MEILLDNDYAVVTFEKELNLIILAWKKFVNDVEYRNTFELVKEKVIEFAIPYFLSDTRKQGKISPVDRKWLETEIIPPAIKGGLKFSATVLEKNAFKNYYLSKLKAHSTKTGMSAFEMFDDYDKAREWLLSQGIKK